MNQKIKYILFVALVVLGVSTLAGVTLADQITGTLTTGTNSSNATGTLTTGLSNGVSGTVMIPPVANPVAGTYTSAQSVVLTASGALSINYTTDGSTPTCSTGNVYSGSISVGSSETIQAVSCYPDNNASAVSSFAYVINIPSSGGGGGGGGGGGTVVSSGVGGGGGGGYIAPISTPTITTTTTSSIPTVGQVLGASTMNTAALLQELQNLEQQLVTIEFKVNKCSFTFNTNVSKGMTSSEVQSLQKVLNYTSLTQVAISGPGSPNNESTYFGSATKNAVIAFQNIFADQILTPNGLTSGNGYVGSATRSVLNSLCSQ